MLSPPPPHLRTRSRIHTTNSSTAMYNHSSFAMSAPNILRSRGESVPIGRSFPGNIPGEYESDQDQEGMDEEEDENDEEYRDGYAFGNGYPKDGGQPGSATGTHLITPYLYPSSRSRQTSSSTTTSYPYAQPSRSPALTRPYPTRARYSDNNTRNRTPGERNSDGPGPVRRLLLRIRTLRMFLLREHLRQGRLYLNRTRCPDLTIMHKLRRTGILLHRLILQATRRLLRPLILNCNPRRPCLKSSPSQPHLRRQTSLYLPLLTHPTYISRNVSPRFIRS
jgi:hypothetical protein